MPSPSGPSNMRGKIVTMSNLTPARPAAPPRSGRLVQAQQPLRRGDHDPPGLRVDRPAHLARPAGSAPRPRGVSTTSRLVSPLPSTAHHLTDRVAVGRLDPAADQVVVVEHARRQRRPVRRRGIRNSSPASGLGVVDRLERPRSRPPAGLREPDRPDHERLGRPRRGAPSTGCPAGTAPRGSRSPGSGSLPRAGRAAARRAPPRRSRPRPRI